MSAPLDVYPCRAMTNGIPDAPAEAAGTWTDTGRSPTRTVVTVVGGAVAVSSLSGAVPQPATSTVTMAIARAVRSIMPRCSIDGDARGRDVGPGPGGPCPDDVRPVRGPDRSGTVGGRMTRRWPHERATGRGRHAARGRRRGAGLRLQ